MLQIPGDHNRVQVQLFAQQRTEREGDLKQTRPTVPLPEYKQSVVRNQTCTHMVFKQNTSDYVFNIQRQ